MERRRTTPGAIPVPAAHSGCYCVQHHGTPSPPAIQSVAIHALVLYGRLRQGVGADQTWWIRQRLLQDLRVPKDERYEWLTPPEFEQCLTIADIVEESSFFWF